MRILTCNIRKADADDGENNWDRRKDLCVRIIRNRDPDIVCFQEMRQCQFEHIRSRFPEYGFAGLTKTVVCKDPINAVFIKTTAFDVIAAGGYWLSETPHVPGTCSWGSASIRLANWMRLVYKASEKEFRVINTHLDHVSEAAKASQTRMILEDAGAYPDDYPQLLTGDFNMDQTHSLMDAFKDAGWWDTYTNVHLPEDPGNTYHGFEGPRYRTDQGKIDWIVARGRFFTEDAEIIRDSENDRFPSDHYFVGADLVLKQ